MDVNDQGRQPICLIFAGGWIVNAINRLAIRRYPVDRHRLGQVSGSQRFGQAAGDDIDPTIFPGDKAGWDGGRK